MPTPSSTSRRPTVLHAQRRTHRPLGVVLMGDRRTEQGHDRIADDLVDPSAERGDVVGEPGETLSTRFLTCSGSRSSERPVNPTMSAKSTVTTVARRPVGRVRGRTRCRTGRHRRPRPDKRDTAPPQSTRKPTSASVVSTGRNDDRLGIHPVSVVRNASAPPWSPEMTDAPSTTLAARCRRHQDLRIRRHRSPRPRRGRRDLQPG